jgi:hypothetical protein
MHATKLAAEISQIKQMYMNAVRGDHRVALWAARRGMWYLPGKTTGSTTCEVQLAKSHQI